MSEFRPLLLGTSPALKERRLSELLGGRDPEELGLREAVEDAQVLGSLELAGLRPTMEDVRAARAGGTTPAPVRGLLSALRAVEPAAPFSSRALLAWHAALTGGGAGLRSRDIVREGRPPPAPARFVESRLETLAQWLSVESGRELKPAQQGALVMTRLVEIVPFEEGNGRVARLAASHLMVRAGARPPILRAEDAPRLDEALRAAFEMDTQPLCALLDEASARALDVQIRALEGA